MRRLLTIACALSVVALTASPLPAAAGEKRRAPNAGADTRTRKPDPPHVQGGGGEAPQPQGTEEEGKGSEDDFGKKSEPKEGGQQGPKK